jgi:uncharacterized protein YlaI
MKPTTECHHDPRTSRPICDEVRSHETATVTGKAIIIRSIRYTFKCPDCADYFHSPWSIRVVVPDVDWLLRGEVAAA